MGPETPRIVDFLLHTFYLYIVLFWIKSYFQRAHRARTAPQDACHPIYNPLTQQPLFDARWHSRLLDSARELLHLRTGLGGIIDQCDFVHPFYASASIPAGNNQADRRAVILGQ